MTLISRILVTLFWLLLATSARADHVLTGANWNIDLLQPLVCSGGQKLSTEFLQNVFTNDLSKVIFTFQHFSGSVFLNSDLLLGGATLDLKQIYFDDLFIAKFTKNKGSSADHQEKLDFIFRVVKAANGYSVDYVDFSYFIEKTNSCPNGIIQGRLKSSPAD